MDEEPHILVLVSFPDAPYTESLIKKALQSLNASIVVHQSIDSIDSGSPLLQWSTYDSILHELTLNKPTQVLSSSYIIRKSLIRKHFLHRAIQTYLAKNSNSSLKDMVPTTWDVEISHSDELDEMWSDELYDLGQVLPEESSSDDRPTNWYILKPGMADRGMGIRLFKSRNGLQRIFDSFEEADDDSEEGNDEEEEDATNVITSQLRHFVIQEYLPNPLLLDPREALDPAIAPGSLHGRKFHLRAYCVAQGALKVHLYTRILALFSSMAYAAPSSEEEGSPSLSAHLTNTALQESHGEENVRLLQELVGCRILSAGATDDQKRLTQADVDAIVDNVGICLGEVFRAGLTSAVHFQTLPNAFELFGADLLVTFDAKATPPFRVNMLELNAEPAIHLTGPRLGWILEELFDEIANSCVAPFFFSPKLDATHAHAHPLASVQGRAHEVEARPQRGKSKGHLRTCLEIQVRGASGW